MIKVRILQIYNEMPYYRITKDRAVYNAFGAEQAASTIKDLRKGREKINIESIDSVIEEHTKLCELLK